MNFELFVTILLIIFIGFLVFKNKINENKQKGKSQNNNLKNTELKKEEKKEIIKRMI